MCDSHDAINRGVWYTRPGDVQLSKILLNSHTDFLSSYQCGEESTSRGVNVPSSNLRELVRLNQLRFER